MCFVFCFLFLFSFFFLCVCVCVCVCMCVWVGGWLCVGGCVRGDASCFPRDERDGISFITITSVGVGKS